MRFENQYKKSKLIVFSKYRRRNHKLYIDGKQLEHVDEYTYLGMVSYRTGCLRQTSLSLSKKASKASMSFLQALHKKNIPINILLKGFDTTIHEKFGNLTPEQYFMKTDTDLRMFEDGSL